MNLTPDKWYSEFLGVGYRYHDVDMNVLLLFSNRRLAAAVWNKTVDGWADNQIRLIFVEDDDQYWLLLFHEGSSLLLKDNTGFIKRVPLSTNYVKFKQRYDSKVILRFATYDKIKSKPKDKDNSTPSFSVSLLKKIKHVYGVGFFQYNEIPEKTSILEAIKGVRKTLDG
jgi:hypothetical protein